MKIRFAILFAVLSVAVFVNAQSKNTQDASKTDNKTDSKTDAAQVLSTAEITKIDVKKKILEVREVVEAPPAQQGREGSRRNGGGYPGDGTRRRTGGGYPGGGGRYPGGGGGGYPGGSRYPNGGGSTAAKKPKEFKVFVLNDTDMTFAQAKIDFDQLHVGDKISVAGTPKGSKGDLEAKRIERF
jgi:hypothetical protein